MKGKRMFYDPEEEQWYVDIQGRKYGLHCGETIYFYIGRNAIPCRLELSYKWYVIMGEMRFDLREKDQYTVSF
ncbi:DUF5348 domain-containing protein [Aquibacillus sp. 3ASR75-11]|uniref:DUF5348 domain-containing protein n=1 Tax=Terrihalobacillus insolitus TaxID=2950438 RepID=A0A9X3WRW1_9BACI|nr:DUF5348 domain-containing protein [Terrihalobacillus insolitus]MDC3424245.1 DUF5348 domain-containing protein [Terrihalobacillus insolitus]